MVKPFPLEHRQAADEASSRSNAEWAGWDEVDGHWTWNDDETLFGAWTGLLPSPEERRWQTFSWLSTRALLDSVNDQIAKRIGDLVDPRRQRWIAAQRVSGKDPDLVLEAPGRSLMIVGDPGEIDASQFAVIPPLLQIDKTRGSSFLVVLSDVIYPEGDINDYASGFYEAFAAYGKPIYALPGNHDWYDGLNGFMWNFCGAEALPPTEYRAGSYTASERIARTLWRQAARPNRTELLSHRSPKGEAWVPRQPGPYWAMDIGDAVRLIAIDTGIKGGLDREQGAWLLRMASDTTKPKVLLTGKPLWVDGEHHPGHIDWGRHGPPKPGMNTIDDIVRARAHGFRAAIGGDVHNYQRTTVTVDDAEGPRRIEYVVTGGGGAYLSDTHRIAVKPTPEDLPDDVVPPGEAQFRCYPTRADSLAYYTRWYGRRIVLALALALAAAVAAVAALVLWDRGGPEVGGQEAWEVATMAVAGVLAVAVIVAVVGWLARRAFDRGSRATAMALLLPAAFTGAALLGATLLDHTWDWAWRAALVGVAVIVLPLAVIVISYYGFATPHRRRLGGSVLAVAIAGLFLADFGSAEATVAAIAIGLSVVALLLWITKPGFVSVPGFLREPAVTAIVVIVAYQAPLVAALVRFDDPWALKAAVAAELGLVALVAAVIFVVVTTGGGRALRHMARGRLDPDDAFAVLRARGIDEALTPTARQGTATAAAGRVADFLMKPSRGRKLARTGLAQIGNADTPPMFKNFVHAEVSEDGTTLDLSCYGVTGWAAHEVTVPREDCVRIDLT